MINDIKTSVALATYNGASYILEQLNSINNQTIKVDEVIICDDQSSDGTVQIVNQFIINNKLGSWKVYVNEERLNFCDNFWKAINLCKNDIVFLCDQDDVWYLNKVEETIKIMESDNDINLVSSSYGLCDARGEKLNGLINQARVKDDGSLEDIVIAGLINNTCARGCSMAFKKSILNDEKLFSSTVGLIGHDWIVGFYASLKGRAVFYNKQLFDYRVHSTNATISSQSEKHRFTKKLAHIRIDGLTSEYDIIKNLVNHNMVNIDDKNKMTKQLNFLRLRMELLQNFNVINVMKLLLNLKSYTKICRYGFKSGLKYYLGDVIYSVKFYKHLRYKNTETTK